MPNGLTCDIKQNQISKNEIEEIWEILNKHYLDIIHLKDLENNLTNISKRIDEIEQKYIGDDYSEQNDETVSPKTNKDINFLAWCIVLTVILSIFVIEQIIFVVWFLYEAFLEEQEPAEEFDEETLPAPFLYNDEKQKLK